MAKANNKRTLTLSQPDLDKIGQESELTDPPGAKKSKPYKQTPPQPATQQSVDDLTKLVSTYLPILNNISTTYLPLLNDIKSSVESVKGEVNVLTSRIVTLESTTSQTQSKSSDHSKELEQIQIVIRKLNLIVVGLFEDVNETEASLLQKMQSFVETDLELEGVPVDHAFRLGPLRTDGRSRNVKIKFVCESHRTKVWNNRMILRSKKIGIYVNEDLPPVTQNRRALLREECNKAFQLGKRTKLHGDRLSIDDVWYEMTEDGVLIQAAERLPRRPRTGLRRGVSRFNPTTTATTTRSGAIPSFSATGQASKLLRQHQQLEPVLDMDTSSLAFANNDGTSNPTRSTIINGRAIPLSPSHQFRNGR
jgi:hypothetical protein